MAESNDKTSDFDIDLGASDADLLDLEQEVNRLGQEKA